MGVPWNCSGVSPCCATVHRRPHVGCVDRGGRIGSQRGPQLLGVTGYVLMRESTPARSELPCNGWRPTHQKTADSCWSL